MKKMEYIQINKNGLPVVIRASRFEPEHGKKECHAWIELTDALLSVQEQCQCIRKAIVYLEGSVECKGMTTAWKRYFLSDAVNQVPFLSGKENGAVSLVQQPPLNGTKLAVWIYMIEGIETEEKEEGIHIESNGYVHLFHTQLHAREGDSFSQTEEIFRTYIQLLENYGCTLKANCIRTWLFVRDVDTRYGGLVKARKELFEKEGLTEKTHYIASTGIEGWYIHPEVFVHMDAYAISGIQEEQVGYLHAPSHLNPTHEYGVTFERGTVVQYGDRRHVFISGTASIDNKGQILHPADIRKQTERVLENIEALLAEADVDLTDLAHMMIYLRDPADYTFTERYFTQHYPDVPRIILLAPVCRPGWLIEVECVAIKNIGDDRYKDF